VELGKKTPKEVEIVYAADSTGKVELLADDLRSGKLLTSYVMPVIDNGKWEVIRKKITPLTGQHDIYLRIRPGKAESIKIKSIRFIH
jgi:hypothetical protein